jgi:hypothetical protein
MAELPHTRFRGRVLDARDAVELARFYALKMEFQGADDYAAPVWPNAAGEQQMMMHVDIAVEVLGGEGDPRPRFFELVDHAVSLGARIAEHQPHEDRLVVMLDPAGHPFCLVPASMS